MSSVYSFLTGSTTTNSFFDAVAGISLEIGYTAHVGLNGVVLHLVERTPWRVCVMWPLRFSAVVRW